jgi:flagellar FliL protein
MANDDTPPAKKSPLVLILLATNVLSLAGVGAAWFLAPSIATPPAEAGEEEQEAEQEERDLADIGVTVEVGKFTINLSDPGSPRYLKAKIQAAVSSESTKEEVKERNGQLRDVAISYLSSLSLSDTQGARAKEDIRESLRKRMNNLLRSGEVLDIFFTEFVTQ